MIIRQVQCVVAEEDAPAFLANARGVVSEHVGRVDGLISLQLAVRHLGHGEVRIIAQSQWRDFSSMQAYLQDNLYKPGLWDPEEKWLRSADVEHFEVVAREVDESQLAGPEEGTPDA